MNWLIGLDHALFEKINLDWTNRFFDWFFPAITDLHKNVGFQAIALVLVLFWIFKQRLTALKWLLAIVVTVTLCDVISYRVIKPLVHRSRPPQTVGVIVVERGASHSGDSFPSNHATNNIGVATMLSFAIPQGAPIFYLIALLVCYSRPYVGAHFPGDVLGGMILGFAVAHFVRALFARWLKPARSKK